MKAQGLYTFICLVAAGQAISEEANHRDQPISIKTATAEMVLAGTLTVPANKKPKAAVVLISGSGGHVRHQVISGTPMFKVMAEHFSKAGIASLRVDDRGKGESTGPSVQVSTTRDRANDIQACLSWLCSQFESTPIGLIGHSEGAMIAPMVATEDERVAFVVLLSAPTIRGREVFIDQQLAQTRAEGTHTEQELKTLEKALANLADTVMAKGDQNAVEDAIRDLFKAWKAPPEAFEGPDIGHFAKAMTTPWRKHFFQYDPKPALTKLTQPVLAIYGSNDQQTAFAANAPGFTEAMASAPSKSFQLIQLPNEDHFFLRAPGEPPGKHIYVK